jgi:renierapurpurin 18,18'-hydroxylase
MAVSSPALNVQKSCQDGAIDGSPEKARQDVRRAAMSRAHWYVVARSIEVTQTPLAVTLWGEAIVLFRTAAGQVYALEDRCPHRQVKLSHGAVVGDHLECAYHGWQFNGVGRCAVVPYLTEKQKLPSCQIKHYPVQERDGFVWLCPEWPDRSEAQGDALLEGVPQPLAIPEWDDLNYIATVAMIDCEAHFSFLIENLMDMYHGHLHQGYQAWTSAELERLEETGDRVTAHYEAQSYYRIDKIWSVSQLFFPALRQLHPEPLEVSYAYPHWRSALGQDFRIYCLFAPVSETHTRAYLLHFTSLQAFTRLHKLPDGFRRWVKDRCFGAAQKMLDGLVREDVVMLEEEQQMYLKQPDLRSYELNRAIPAVQRLILKQAAR